jgi:hypothetical protein
MKKLMMVAMALIVACSASFAEKSELQELNKQRKELRKLDKKQLNERSSKAARKEAKKLKKAGWIVSPGTLPLEKQLDRSYQYQYATDDDMNDVWASGNGQSVGEVYDAAKMQATELARLDLASKIGSECTGIIDNLTANKQLPKDEATSISTLMAKSKTVFSQKLGGVKVVVEAYRELPNKNKQVMIRMFAKKADIQNIAKNAIRAELEKRGIKMTQELNTLMGNGK